MLNLVLPYLPCASRARTLGTEKSLRPDAQLRILARVRGVEKSVLQRLVARNFDRGLRLNESIWRGRTMVGDILRAGTVCARRDFLFQKPEWMAAVFGWYTGYSTASMTTERKYELFGALLGDRCVAAFAFDTRVHLCSAPPASMLAVWMDACPYVVSYALCVAGAERGMADRAVVLDAVRQNGLSLRWASPCLRADAGVVYTAVCSDGLALQWAAEALRDDERIVSAAVSNCRRARRFASVRAKRVLAGAREAPPPKRVRL